MKRIIIATILLTSGLSLQAQTSPVITDSPTRQRIANPPTALETASRKRLEQAILLLSDRPDEARRILGQIISEFEAAYPLGPHVFRYGGQTARENQFYRDILKATDAQIVPSPYVSAIALTGLSYLEQADLANAEAFLVKASLIAPYNSAYVNNVGRLWFRRGYPSVAEESFILSVQYAGMRADDTNVDLVTRIDKANGFEGLADAYLMRGDKIHTIQLLQRALAAYPQSVSAAQKLEDLQRKTAP